MAPHCIAAAPSTIFFSIPSVRHVCECPFGPASPTTRGFDQGRESGLSTVHTPSPPCSFLFRIRATASPLISFYGRGYWVEVEKQRVDDLQISWWPLQTPLTTQRGHSDRVQRFFALGLHSTTLGNRLAVCLSLRLAQDLRAQSAIGGADRSLHSELLPSADKVHAVGCVICRASDRCFPADPVSLARSTQQIPRSSNCLSLPSSLISCRLLLMPPLLLICPAPPYLISLD